MTEIVRESNGRGDYIDIWPHHQGGVLIYASHECIVRIDEAGKVDWETTPQYDIEVVTRSGFNPKLRTVVLNEAALLEVTPCEGVTSEVHERFKRLIGEALRCCVALEYSSAQMMLSAARLFIQARVEETSRNWYLSASFLASIPFLAIGLTVWTFRDFYRNLLGVDAVWLILASVAGSVGALLSVIARTGRLKFDCSAGKNLHYLEGASRIVAGAISGTLVALAIKSEIIFAALAQGSKLHIVMMGALIGGAGERLATSIISKFDSTHISSMEKKTRNEKEEKMNRSALIIGCPDAGIPGVRKDMVNYRNFLESPLGGMWKASEIETLQSPTKAVVLQKIQTLKLSDYSFVVFAGHGRHIINTKSTVLTLQSGVEIDSDDLKIGAPKRTLVLDCCRVLTASRMFESAMAKSASFSESLNSYNCRHYFDKRISECHDSLVVLHSCSIGETASETTEDGGLYSSALLDGALDWQQVSNVDTGRSYKILSITEAHALASSHVKRVSGQSQNPTGAYPRVEKQFPFAVIA